MLELYRKRILDQQRAIVHGVILRNLLPRNMFESHLIGDVVRVLAAHSRYKGMSMADRRTLVKREFDALRIAEVVTKKSSGMFSISQAYLDSVAVLLASRKK